MVKIYIVNNKYLDSGSLFYIDLQNKIHLLKNDHQVDLFHFDILVHSIAYAPRELLQGGYLDNLDREGFRIAHETSAYSFAALAKSARRLMNEKGAMLTLSYIGAMKAMPSYNIMGPAKASLEANVRYLAHA